MIMALRDKRGFTLVELLVVVGIIVLLTAIVVPNIANQLTKGRMTAAETQIEEIGAALAAYHADFGTYPGDVFPSEDKNNNGKLDTGEDIGVDINGDGVSDYACANNGTASPNNRLDYGDGVVNIDDLEWALKTTAKNGPYMESIPLDPWDNKYVYHAPMTRPTSDEAYLYIDVTDATEAGAVTLLSEDTNDNGRLDRNEDIGIADYDVNTGVTTDVRTTAPSFVNMRAGAGNGILDHGDDDNKNDVIERYITASPVPDRLEDYYIEMGNNDVSPDGLGRNIGYYLYSIGRNEKDETASGYEDININNLLNMAPFLLTVDAAIGGTFSEDIDTDLTLDTGYEDTGIDGVPGTKDMGEEDGEWSDFTGNRDEDFSGPYNHDDPANDKFDIGGDDINSWNKSAPWRAHASYGG